MSISPVTQWPMLAKNKTPLPKPLFSDRNTRLKGVSLLLLMLSMCAVFSFLISHLEKTVKSDARGEANIFDTRVLIANKPNTLSASAAVQPRNHTSQQYKHAQQRLQHIRMHNIMRRPATKLDESAKTQSEVPTLDIQNKPSLQRHRPYW